MALAVARASGKSSAINESAAGFVAAWLSPSSMRSNRTPPKELHKAIPAVHKDHPKPAAAVKRKRSMRSAVTPAHREATVNGTVKPRVAKKP